MNKREKQLRNKIAMDFFNKEGRIPSSSELRKLTLNKKAYDTIVEPEVPLKGVTSSSDKASTLFKAMLLERRNISALLEDAKNRIARLKDSVNAETNNFLGKASAIVRKYKESINKRIFYKGDVTSPIVGSTNVSISGGGILLERSKVNDILFKTKVSAYNEQGGAVPAMRTIKASDPITVNVQGTKGVNKGVKIELNLKNGANYVSELILDVDPCYLRVLLDNSTSNYIDRFASGPLTLAIGKIVSKVTIILFDSPAILTFRIRSLSLNSAVYAGDGTFNTGEYLAAPITVDTSSFLFNPDSYIPDGTEIKWYYAKDANIDGYFGAPNGTLPNSNLPQNSVDYNDDSTDHGLKYSQVYNYSEEVASPLEWVEFEPENIVDWNATEQTALTEGPIETHRYLTSLGTLNTNFDVNSVKLGFGKDMWLFESKKVAGADLIRSVLTIGDKGFVLDMINPYIIGANHPLFSNIAIIGIGEENNINESINITQNTSFTYDFPKGKYNIIFTINNENPDFNLETTVITLDDIAYTPYGAMDNGYSFEDVLKAINSNLVFEFYKLTAPDILGRTATVQINHGMVRADFDELYYGRTENIVNYSVQGDGTVCVPNIFSVNGRSLLHAVDPTDTTPDPKHPYLTGTCSDNNYDGNYDACITAAGTWSVSRLTIDSLYTNSTMRNYFYDISYNIRTDISLDKLFLRAVLKGNLDKSPVIRNLEVTSE